MFHWTVEIQLLIHPWHLFSFKVQIYGPPHFTCPAQPLGPLGPETKQMLCHKLTTATTVTDVTVGYLQDFQSRPVSPFLQNIWGRCSQQFGCLSARKGRLTMANGANRPVRAGGSGWQQVDIHGLIYRCIPGIPATWESRHIQSTGIYKHGFP